MECRSFLEELENLLRKKVEKNLQDVHAQLPKYEIDDLVRHAEADFAMRLFKLIEDEFDELGRRKITGDQDAK